jgi:hypothetical protein
MVGVVDATWSAMLLLSLLVLLNLGTVFVRLFGFGHPLLSSSRFWGVAVAGTILLMNYLIFIRKDRCFAIIAEFDKSILYVVATFYLLLSSPR